MENRYTVYPFAEAVLATSESVEGSPVAVDIFSIQDGMVVELVLAYIKSHCVDAEANNLIVGDDDDDDGYIVAASAKAADATIYGQAPVERGAYLYDATEKGSFVKVYTAPKTLKLKLSAAPDAEGEYLVYIFGHRAIPL